VKSIIFVSLLTGACSWTTFDDLESETWVTSTEKPDNDSSNWGVAIQRAQSSGLGGRLVVMGASQSLYSELAVTSDGDIAVPSTTLELNSQFGIGNLDPQPILLADPASNDVALVTSSGSASIAVLKGAAGTLNVHNVFGPSNPDAATYMVPAAGGLSQTLVAEGDKVYGTFFVNPPNPQPSCKLVDAGNQQVLVRALGAIPATGGANDVVVWSSTGKVLVYPGGTLFNGCAMAGPSFSSAADTTVKPGKGSQILTFTQSSMRYALLQGHDDTGNGMLALFSLDGVPTMLGSARAEQGVRTAALFEHGGKRYVVAGYPNAVVDGTSGAGQALVFEVDLQSGVGATAVATLYDAQPESKQQFGRAVTVMPFDGKPVIVVAADNEVFTYFRTTLYDETRTGR
jgi:hypothetical protein